MPDEILFPVTLSAYQVLQDMCLATEDFLSLQSWHMLARKQCLNCLLIQKALPSSF